MWEVLGYGVYLETNRYLSFSPLPSLTHQSKVSQLNPQLVRMACPISRLVVQIPYLFLLRLESQAACMPT